MTEKVTAGANVHSYGGSTRGSNVSAASGHVCAVRRNLVAP